MVLFWSARPKQGAVPSPLQPFIWLVKTAQTSGALVVLLLAVRPVTGGGAGGRRTGGADGAHAGPAGRNAQDREPSPSASPQIRAVG